MAVALLERATRSTTTRTAPPCPSCGNSLPEHEQARLREGQELLRVSNEWRDVYTPNRGGPGEWLAQIQRLFG